MQNESQYIEDTILKSGFLDLSNAVFVYLKNESPSLCSFGLQKIPGNSEITIPMNGTMMKEGTKIKVTFDQKGTGKLYYRLIRFTKCTCNCES